MNKKDYEKYLNKKLRTGIFFCVVGIGIFIFCMIIIVFPETLGSLEKVILFFNYIIFLIIISIIIILIGVAFLLDWDKRNRYYLNNKNRKK